MRRTTALCAFIGLGASLPTWAQTEIQPVSEAQSLSCLQKPADPPRHPARHALDKAFGGMRLLLSFSSPDAAPDVQVLFNSAREDMQDAVNRYVRRYRLPCLTAQDGVVKAVQEFSFTNTDRDATPLPPERHGDAPPFCLVMPRHDMQGPIGRGPETVVHVVIAATFAGDGQQPPGVRILHSTGSQQAEAAVRNRLKDYRMPCRTGKEEPQSFKQQFTFVPNGHPRHVFKREAFGLVEFLRMTHEPRKIKASYDFNTMGCPFKVDYMVYGGAVPNEATVKGPPDLNRQPFLTWLAGLQLGFKDKSQTNDLFGSELQIDVPCVNLALKGED